MLEKHTTAELEQFFSDSNNKYIIKANIAKVLIGTSESKNRKLLDLVILVCNIICTLYFFYNVFV
jgi:hypothetical protein